MSSFLLTENSRHEDQQQPWKSDPIADSWKTDRWHLQANDASRTYVDRADRQPGRAVQCTAAHSIAEPHSVSAAILYTRSALGCAANSVGDVVWGVYTIIMVDLRATEFSTDTIDGELGMPGGRFDAVFVLAEPWWLPVIETSPKHRTV